jgi:phosphopentomutase
VGIERNYTRTTKRCYYSLASSETTILEDEIKNSKGEVIGIGKIEDIFNDRGITKATHTKGNLNGTDTTLNEVNQSRKVELLIFTNLVDFVKIFDIL